jgi:hypothetical protein
VSPEQIVPATVRSILGDELMALLYGNGAGETGAVENERTKT